MLTRTLYRSSAREGKTASTRPVVVRQTPVDDEHVLRGMVDQHVLRLHVAMHDATTVGIIQTLGERREESVPPGSCRSNSATPDQRAVDRTPNAELTPDSHTRKSFVSTHFVTMLQARVSGFITIPNNYLLPTTTGAYRNDKRAVRQLLHNLNFSRILNRRKQRYLRIFFFRTGFRYLILTGSPVFISMALKTSLYFPLPTFRTI